MAAEGGLVNVILRTIIIIATTICNNDDAKELFSKTTQKIL